MTNWTTELIRALFAKLLTVPLPWRDGLFLALLTATAIALFSSLRWGTRTGWRYVCILGTGLAYLCACLLTGTIFTVRLVGEIVFHVYAGLEYRLASRLCAQNLTPSKGVFVVGNTIQDAIVKTEDGRRGAWSLATRSRNAFLRYWHWGVTVATPYDLEGPAETARKQKALHLARLRRNLAGATLVAILMAPAFFHFPPIPYRALLAQFLPVDRASNGGSGAGKQSRHKGVPSGRGSVVQKQGHPNGKGASARRRP